MEDFFAKIDEILNWLYDVIAQIINLITNGPKTEGEEE